MERVGRFGSKIWGYWVPRSAFEIEAGLLAVVDGLTIIGGTNFIRSLVDGNIGGIYGSTALIAVCGSLGFFGRKEIRSLTRKGL